MVIRSRRRQTDLGMLGKDERLVPSEIVERMARTLERSFTLVAGSLVLASRLGYLLLRFR